MENKRFWQDVINYYASLGWDVSDMEATEEGIVHRIEYLTFTTKINPADILL